MSHTPVTTGVTLDGELGDANLPNLLVRPARHAEAEAKPAPAALRSLPAERLAPPVTPGETTPARPARDTSRGFTGAGDPVPVDNKEKELDTLRGYQLPGQGEPERALPETETEPELEALLAPAPAPPAPSPARAQRPPSHTEETAPLVDEQKRVDTLVTGTRWGTVLRWSLLLGGPALVVIALATTQRANETAPVLSEPDQPQPALGDPPAPVKPAALVKPPAPAKPAALVARGAIEPRMRASVRSRVGGEIAEVLVTAGQTVREGDVLVRLVATDYQHELELTRQQLSAARARLDQALGRTSSLAATEVSDESEARQALRAAQAAERNAQLRLADTTIAAPFAGQVIARDARPGEPVAPGPQGRSLVTLADLSDGYVRVDLAASDAARMRVGQRVKIATPRGDLDGEVAVVAAASPTGTVPVRVRLGPIDARLLGATATVTVER
jgi:HlyD family secretion protein